MGKQPRAVDSSLAEQVERMQSTLKRLSSRVGRMDASITELQGKVEAADEILLTPADAIGVEIEAARESLKALASQLKRELGEMMPPTPEEIALALGTIAGINERLGQIEIRCKGHVG